MNSRSQTLETTSLETAARREVRTRSGSRYVIVGNVVHRLHDDGSADTFDLIGVCGGRLSYTDGDRVHVSSPIVSGDRITS